MHPRILNWNIAIVAVLTDFKNMAVVLSNLLRNLTFNWSAHCTQVSDQCPLGLLLNMSYQCQFRVWIFRFYVIWTKNISVKWYSNLCTLRSYVISIFWHFTKSHFDLWTFRFNSFRNSDFSAFQFDLLTFRSYVISIFGHYTKPLDISY